MRSAPLFVADMIVPLLIPVPPRQQRHRPPRTPGNAVEHAELLRALGPTLLGLGESASLGLELDTEEFSRVADDAHDVGRPSGRTANHALRLAATDDGDAAVHTPAKDAAGRQDLERGAEDGGFGHR